MSAKLPPTIAAALVLASLPAAAQTRRAPAATPAAAAVPAPAVGPPPTAPAPEATGGQDRPRDGWRSTLLVGLPHLSDQDGVAARVDLDADLVSLAPLAPRGVVSDSASPARHGVVTFP